MSLDEEDHGGKSKVLHTRYEDVLPNRRLVVDLQCRICERMENVKGFMNVLDCWHKTGDDDKCGAS